MPVASEGAKAASRSVAHFRRRQNISIHDRTERTAGAKEDEPSYGRSTEL
jgi:hypothetical protein